MRSLRTLALAAFFSVLAFGNEIRPELYAGTRALGTLDFKESQAYLDLRYGFNYPVSPSWQAGVWGQAQISDVAVQKRPTIADILATVTYNLPREGSDPALFAGAGVGLRYVDNAATKVGAFQAGRLAVRGFAGYRVRIAGDFYYRPALSFMYVFGSRVESSLLEADLVAFSLFF